MIHNRMCVGEHQDFSIENGLKARIRGSGGYCDSPSNRQHGSAMHYTKVATAAIERKRTEIVKEE